MKKIKNLYGDRPAKVREIYNNKKIKKISDILVTKILLGTLACTPAYDTNFSKGINKYKKRTGTPNPYSMKILSDFYNENKDTLNNLLIEFEKDDVKYPQMKLLDMGFFEYGKIDK